MPGFMAVVEAVGGITVYNEREIADDHLQFYLSVGEHRLDAADALRFVRSRKGQAGGDFARAHRQQQVLSALRHEMMKPQNLAKMPDIIEALSLVINTNFPPDKIDQLLALSESVADEPRDSWVFRPPEWAKHLPTEPGQRSVMYPLMGFIAQLSIDLFGENSLYYGHPLPSNDPPRET
jgi:hypothetical protein